MEARQRYGTLLCDLERRRIIDLQPDREAATVEAWLAEHPGISLVSRDRGGGYGQAASHAAPQAVQVADRWHPMESASAAFLEAVRRSMRAIRQALRSATIDPALLTRAERNQYDGFVRRQEDNQSIKDLARQGASIKDIARRTSRGRKLVRSVLRGSDAMSFAAARRRLSLIWPGSVRNGRQAAATAPNCGADCAPPDLEAACGW